MQLVKASTRSNDRLIWPRLIQNRQFGPKIAANSIIYNGFVMSTGLEKSGESGNFAINLATDITLAT